MIWFCWRLAGITLSCPTLLGELSHLQFRGCVLSTWPTKNSISHCQRFTGKDNRQWTFTKNTTNQNPTLVATRPRDSASLFKSVSYLNADFSSHTVPSESPSFNVGFVTSSFTLFGLAERRKATSSFVLQDTDLWKYFGFYCECVLIHTSPHIHWFAFSLVHCQSNNTYESTVSGSFRGLLKDETSK